MKYLLSGMVALLLIIGVQAKYLLSYESEVTTLELSVDSLTDTNGRLKEEAFNLNQIHDILVSDRENQRLVQAEVVRAQNRILSNVKKSACFTDTSSVPAEYVRVLME